MTGIASTLAGGGGMLITNPTSALSADIAPSASTAAEVTERLIEHCIIELFP